VSSVKLGSRFSWPPLSRCVKVTLWLFGDWTDLVAVKQRGGCCWICWSRSCSDLVHSAIELRNQTLSPTLRQRAFFLGLVLPGYSTLVVWRLNHQCALWHLYNITKSDVFPRQCSVTQHPADVLRLGLSHNLAGELSSPCPATNANLRFQCYCSHAFLCSL